MGSGRAVVRTVRKSERPWMCTDAEVVGPSTRRLVLFLFSLARLPLCTLKYSSYEARRRMHDLTDILHSYTDLL